MAPDRFQSTERPGIFLLLKFAKRLCQRLGEIGGDGGFFCNIRYFMGSALALAEVIAPSLL